MDIRDILPADLPALLALNNAEAAAVNAQTPEGMAQLLTRAWAARMTTDGSGFLIAFDAATPPQGPNHAWFTARESSFAYIDRVVVRPDARGRGVARALYADAERLAAAERMDVLCCEVNLDPPNPGSMAFHERLGFAPAGEAIDRRNGKRVRYLSRPVSLP
jgi:predicted GNAT superfamily acetyltransferase